MKILLLAPGRSIHTHKWAMYYKERGYDVKVASFEQHYSEENAKEIDTISLKQSFPGKLSYFGCVPQIKKILKEFKPDIFHAHYVSSYGLVGALCHYAPFYVSVWGRDIFTFPQQGKVNKAMATYTLKKADVICSTSHVMAKETNKYTNKKVFVTPFGVDMSHFRPIEDVSKPEGFTVGTVKALSDKYGIADLIKAFSIVSKKHPSQSMNLLIVGDGEQRNEYEELAKELSVDAQTTFTGRVHHTEVPQYINKMDVFGVPSTEDSESFGVAAVESMACGVPVVVSDVGGLPEVVKDGETGYVVQKQSPEQLAEKIEFLMLNQDQARIMGQKGIEHVKNTYDWTLNAKGMTELYRQTLNKGMKS
ncbi:glycosyltransferase [Jeotgalibacillus sp. R-1-5s-1]|uniref:glycosyltransferase n=1 Tax=Jeotgalibacillus sp. R-1-5s-1 TaxID=2555897 RepID=UPI00106AD56C|nr:glycosyltransferase [Jeotgalibacillus sp. R-1-5s-1]TFD95760.1 glycosyltransferase family 4 protein [Jeotgalibacillus sp. R-1-5s-1]